MHTLESRPAPNPTESLGAYIRRLRGTLGFNQKELADKVGVHVQSIGKLERGITTRLNHKTKKGLARALGIPVEYLDASIHGTPIEANATIKFCPQCWVPGTAPDPLWLSFRAKYCFACATPLSSHCSRCQEPILSLKHRFCPYCGQFYKTQHNEAKGNDATPLR